MFTLVYELHYVFSPLYLVPLLIALGCFFSPQLSRWVDSLRDTQRHPDASLSNRARYVLSICFLCLFLLFFGSSLMKYHRVRQAYASGHYSEVTGTAEDCHAAIQGDPYERFTAGGASFSYSDSEPGIGYAGSVIPGDTYRIRYMLDPGSQRTIILRLEHLESP